jgi:hypothetical protein
VLFLSCKANARVKLAKTEHGPNSSTLVVMCVVRLLIVLFYVLFVCKRVLPPGDSPTAVNKYVNINIFAKNSGEEALKHSDIHQHPTRRRQETQNKRNDLAESITFVTNTPTAAINRCVCAAYVCGINFC